MLGPDRLIDAVRDRKQSVAYVGAALALAGAGTASAATIGAAATGHDAASAHSVATPITARVQTMALTYPAGDHPTSDHRPPNTPKSAAHPASLAAAHAAARHHRSGRGRSAHRRATRRHLTLRHHRARHHRPGLDSWTAVSAELNWQTNPAAAKHGEMPMADQLMPTALSGPQSDMPISPAQYANATTIVQQALAKRMGIRSAVIAVATAMQESELINVNYGTSESLGLFQQQPDDGWGTAAQVMDPAYAADAFLNALARYQANDPTWAAQPLYQAAQGVQASAFPTAYAQWEQQAAQLVKSIAVRLAQEPETAT